MTKTKKFRTLEKGILLLRRKAKISPLSVAEILSLLSGKGRSLILIVLSIPFCQPIQIPGLSIPFGLAIAFIGLRIVFGKRIWLPKKLLAKKVSSSTFEKITDKTLILVRKLKSWIHPRLIGMCHSSFMEKVNGLIIFILGILLAFPLPIPLSNLTAAWSIFLVALGMLEDDGVFILIGYLVSLLTVGFFLLMGLTAKNIFQVS
ncbi:MAG: exopolysaccharide biosynthesis protein [Chlamydiales bacterium]|nr:exopolysaccharide biosynthesis protein [Chlamydiales bacterium]